MTLSGRKNSALARVSLLTLLGGGAMWLQSNRMKSAVEEINLFREDKPVQTYCRLLQTKDTLDKVSDRNTTIDFKTATFPEIPEGMEERIIEYLKAEEDKKGPILYTILANVEANISKLEGTTYVQSYISHREMMDAESSPLFYKGFMGMILGGIGTLASVAWGVIRLQKNDYNR